VFTLHGDGELQEGQEAAMYASNHVDLISTIDVNGQQIDGVLNGALALETYARSSKPVKVLTIKGNDMESVVAGMKEAISLSRKRKPVCIPLHTEMGH
jgi:transketolase